MTESQVPVPGARRSMILNADLGEWETPARTRALMRLVGAANLACGGHAGGVSTMTRAIQWAIENGVRIGAHPGTPAERGRSPVPGFTGDALEVLVLQQVSALNAIVVQEGGSLHHIKLHGWLYHATEQDAGLCRRYLQVVQRFFPSVVVVALANGRVARAAERSGVGVWHEVFADRAYTKEGTLIPRSEPGSVLTRPNEVLAQLASRTADTVCVHADSPDAVAIARTVVRLLQDPS